VNLAAGPEKAAIVMCVIWSTLMVAMSLSLVVTVTNTAFLLCTEISRESAS
jgi:hypothetical protein